MKRKNKGFTLVEVIVILVILAILAAVLIPSMSTYIDKAREKQIIANARSAYVAAQTLLTEEYGTSATFEAGGNSMDADGRVTGNSVIADDKVRELAQLGSGSTFAYTYDKNASITAFSYKENDRIAILNATTGSWTVDDVDGDSSGN